MPVPGLDPKKPASRMVLGSMFEGAGMAAPHAFALLDYFAEHGGNCFDTAYVYGLAGHGEKMLGEWMKQRGKRKDSIVISKGAHTPFCEPRYLRSQFVESLDRMQTDYADIYMMHRDNLEIPVGEFVDVMNEQVQAGRMKIFGGSNWSIERIDEANAYAKKKGLQGFGAVSNQLSLARMINPVWSGCISASDPASKAWLKKTGIPLFAWSSQARGFFVRGSRNFTSDAELFNCWYSDDNFERLKRVRELAREKKTEPIHIAAAYVLHQPFPVFALIGPRQLSELSSSLQAFDVSLKPGEMAWLNLESKTR
jgi:aryl-alcohol dehydrogenase-like predicted oxidoreductase